MIYQLEEANEYAAAVQANLPNLPAPPKSVGYGIGLAVALFVMEMAATLFTGQAMQRGMVIGFLCRSSVRAFRRYVAPCPIHQSADHVVDRSDIAEIDAIERKVQDRVDEWKTHHDGLGRLQFLGMFTCSPPDRR